MLAPLTDSIEIIHVPAYLPKEKFNIAKQYLIPNLEKEYALKMIESQSDIAQTP